MNNKQKAELTEERLTYLVLKAFFRVYNRLGFGFLERVYVLALKYELRQMGLRIAREFSVRIYYDGIDLCQYRLDMVVNEKLVVECKSTYVLRREAPRELFNQLRATNLEVGLLLHFGPEAKFFRLYAPNDRKNPTNPEFPELCKSDSE